MNTQSKELTEFYKAYLKWLEEGAPEDKPFSRYYGMCTNMGCNRIAGRVQDEMIQQFRDAGLNPGFPFGEDAYDYDGDRAEHHLNPDRIKWVKDHANG